MLNSFQNKLLDMLVWFDQFCNSHELKYYAIGGTLLGAIRHNGFIPWDDDIDLALPRPEYERLLSLSNTIKGKYVLESPYSGNLDYQYSFSKIYDTTTTLIERTRSKCKRGIYIDIFPLDGIGNDEKESVMNYKRIDRLNMFLMTRTCAVNAKRSFIKNASIVIARTVPSFIVNDKQLSIKVDKLASYYRFENSEYIGNLMGAYREREIFKHSYIGKDTRYTFENITLPGFEHYDEYLSHIYGNWREIPPVEKRNGSHDYLSYDLDHSYLLNNALE